MSKLTTITTKNSMIKFVIFHHLGIVQKLFEMKIKHTVSILGWANFSGKNLG